MAAADPTETEGDSFEDSVSLNCFFRINRTAGVKSASARQQGRHEMAIRGEQQNHRHAQHHDHNPRCSDRRFKIRSSSLSTPLPPSPAALLRAITRTSAPGRSKARRRRKNSRTCRLIRLRVTELPTLPLTVIPNRDSGPSLARLMMTKFVE